jgi:uncharacterized membrane protein
MKKKLNYVSLTIITLAVMIFIHILAEEIIFHLWPNHASTVNYFGWFAIGLVAWGVIFKEISIQEIKTKKVTIYGFGIFAHRFSLSKLIQKITWCLVLIFLVLFILSFINPIHKRIEEIIGGQIILWLTSLTSMIILIVAVIASDFLLEKLDKKINPIKK